MSVLASDSWSLLTGMEPDMVFCCCSPSATRLIDLCLLRCFLAHQDIKKWLWEVWLTISFLATGKSEVHFGDAKRTVLFSNKGAKSTPIQTWLFLDILKQQTTVYLLMVMSIPPRHRAVYFGQVKDFLSLFFLSSWVALSPHIQCSSDRLWI